MLSGERSPLGATGARPCWPSCVRGAEPAGHPHTRPPSAESWCRIIPLAPSARGRVPLDRERWAGVELQKRQAPVGGGCSPVPSQGACSLPET